MSLVMLRELLQTLADPEARFYCARCLVPGTELMRKRWMSSLVS